MNKTMSNMNETKTNMNRTISSLTAWKENHPISQVVYDTCMSKHKETDVINNMKFSDPTIKKYVDEINVGLFDLLIKNKELLCKNKKFIKIMAIKIFTEMTYNVDYEHLCSTPIDELVVELKEEILRIKKRNSNFDIGKPEYNSSDLSEFDINNDMKFIGGAKGVSDNLIIENEYTYIIQESNKISQMDKLQLSFGMLAITFAKKFCKDASYDRNLVISYLNKLIDEFCSNKKLEHVLKLNYTYLMNHLSTL
jgi:hypothetical protein